MELLILPLILVAVLVVVALLRKRPSEPAQPKVAGYRKVDSILSPAERSFFGVLEQATSNQYRILCKVRLADVIQPAKGLKGKEWWRAFNSIASKHMDFVLLNKDTLEPLLAIELDDKSHQAEDRSKRDAFVDDALKSAGLKLVRVPVKSGYALDELRQVLGLNALETPHPQPAPSVPGPTPAQPTHNSVPTPVNPPVPEANPAQMIQPQTSNPTCPRCSASMVKRQAKTGDHAGKWFWACSRYPQCKAIIPIP